MLLKNEFSNANRSEKISMSFSELLQIALSYNSKELQTEIIRINSEYGIQSEPNIDIDDKPFEAQKMANLMLGQCIYVFIKGDRRGKMCGNLVHRKKKKFCHRCARKKESKDEKYK